MKIAYVNYNYSNYKQNFYNNKTANNPNKGISFNGNSLYMEHLTEKELGLLSKYATTLKENKISTNILLGPTFETIEKVMKTDTAFNSLQEFIQLALRAENCITNKMLLKAKYFSCLCAERYPKEQYSKKVNEALSQIEKSEPVILDGILQNPLWSYPMVLQRQADWISVSQAIIRECDEREKTVNIKLQNLDEKFSQEYLKLRDEIRKERKERQDAIEKLKERIGAMAGTIPRPGTIKGMRGYSLSAAGGNG